jgi:hypothetical protein
MCANSNFDLSLCIEMKKLERATPGVLPIQRGNRVD